MPPRRTAEVAAVFSALGDPTRLSLALKLGGGRALSIAQLTDGTDVTRQAVTKHLRVLEDAGLVTSVKRGREVLYAVFTLGLLFPVAVAILPIFIMVRNLGLLDNPLGVALPQAAFGLPMTIVILRPFFASFPNELQDAAAIDGCGPFRFFWRILLPLSRPVLATVSVLALIGISIFAAYAGVQRWRRVQPTKAANASAETESVPEPRKRGAA